MGIVNVHKPWEECKPERPKRDKVRFWFRSVKEKRCQCGRKADPKRGGVFSWGEYIRGKWFTVKRFCYHCWESEVKEPLAKYARKVVRGEAMDEAQGVELVGYRGEKPRAWMKLKRVCKPRKSKPVVQEIEVLGQKVPVSDTGTYTCPDCGTVGGCRCTKPELVNGVLRPKLEFIYECHCGFKTLDGLVAADHNLMQGHRCEPSGEKVRDPVAERRQARLKASG